MRQLVLAHADLGEEFLLQDLTGVWVAKLGHGVSWSVIVDDLDVFGIAIGPSKADAPLIVDPDAHLSGAVAFEGFESIPRRIAKVLDRRRSVKLAELAPRAILDIAGELGSPCT